MDVPYTLRNADRLFISIIFQPYIGFTSFVHGYKYEQYICIRFRSCSVNFDNVTDIRRESYCL